MLDYTALTTLSTLLRLGSFEATAQALNVTPSAVSQRIRALEERMGTVLVRRGQPCTGTDAGVRLARHAETVALMEDEMLAGILPAAGGRPTLRIAVNADSLASWVIPALAAVEGVTFDLVIDDQDHSQDWLRRGDVVAAITGHPGPVQGCDSHALGVMRYVACASPAFAARWFADGVTPAALARAPAITFNLKDRLQSDWVLAALGRRVTLPSHWIASSKGFVDAALAGLGWGMNPDLLVGTHLADGSLVPLIPDRPLDVALHWQVSRISALDGLTRSIRRTAAAALRPAA
jgi:LysR family transcriptional regulator (chromosome initiation inhibitor)